MNSILENEQGSELTLKNNVRVLYNRGIESYLIVKDGNLVSAKDKKEEALCFALELSRGK